MMALFRWILSVIVAVIAVLFALANRQDVAFTWSPLHEAVQTPVFLPVLLALIAGFLLGGAMVWLNGAEGRRERRRLRKELDKKDKQLKEAEARAALPVAPDNHKTPLPSPYE